MAITSDLLTAMNGTSSTSTSSSTSSNNDTSADAIQDRFLTLLIAQLNNQDPTNPLDNAQLTSQLAQLSTVTGIEKLNTSLGSLMTDLQTSQSLQSANMIGHGVFTSGNTVNLASSTTTDDDGNSTTKQQGVLGFNLASDADKVVVSIVNDAGKVIQTVNLGSQSAGVVPVIWDGSTSSNGTSTSAAKDGKYTFTVTATSGGSAVTTTPLSFGTVTSVSTVSGSTKLNVSGVGSVSASDVVQII